jgi:hypothetical protein
VTAKVLYEISSLDNISLDLGKKRNQFRISSQSKVENSLASIESFNRQFQIGKKKGKQSSGDGNRKWEKKEIGRYGDSGYFKKKL